MDHGRLGWLGGEAGKERQQLGMGDRVGLIRFPVVVREASIGANARSILESSMRR